MWHVSSCFNKVYNYMVCKAGLYIYWKLISNYKTNYLVYYRSYIIDINSSTMFYKGRPYTFIWGTMKGNLSYYEGQFEVLWRAIWVTMKGNLRTELHNLFYECLIFCFCVCVFCLCRRYLTRELIWHSQSSIRLSFAICEFWKKR